jgi:hypothetical protein
MYGTIVTVFYQSAMEHSLEAASSTEEETPELCGLRPTSEELIRLRSKARFMHGTNVTVYVWYNCNGIYV